MKGREIYQDEYIQFNLDAFSIDNKITETICKIRDLDSTTVSLLWKECYFNESFK